MEENSVEKGDKTSHDHTYAVYPKSTDALYEQTNYENPLKKKKSKVHHEESEEDHSDKKRKKGSSYLLQPYEEIFEGPYDHVDPYSLYTPLSYPDIYNPHLLNQPYHAFNGYNPYGQYGYPNNYNNIYYTTTTSTTTTTTPTTTTTAAPPPFLANSQFGNSPEALMHLLNSLNQHATRSKTAAGNRRQPEAVNAFVPQLIAEKTLTDMKAQIANTNQQM